MKTSPRKTSPSGESQFLARLLRLTPAAGLTALILVCAAALSTAQGQTPAFPGALGFGANATGGRGGNVYHVTNLNDSGAGSFRDAVGTAGRTVVFDVGGYITLSSEAAVKSNITIAGQTAPGGGIAIRGAEVTFGNQSNIICRFIRFRPGGASNDTDNGLSLYQAKNVIVDHISIEFAKWNNIDAVSEDWQNKPVNNITVQNSIIANPIYQQFGAHTECVGGTWSWFNNIFASGHNRQPLAKINTVFINNTIYNYSAGYTTHTSTAFKHDIINNYFIGGPASAGSDNTWFQIDKNQTIYYAGNYKDRDRDLTLNGTVTTPYWYQGTGTVLAAPWSSVTTALLASANPPLSAAQAVVRNHCDAGVLPRDEMDALVISQAKTLGNGATGTGAGTAGPDGGLYSSQTSTGLADNGFGTIEGGTPPLDSDRDGMPDDWEAAKGFNPGNAADGKTIQASGYSNLEDYLNWLALPHAFVAKNTAALPTSVTIDLRPYAVGFPSGVNFALSNVTGGAVLQAGTGGYNVTFTPTANSSGLAGFTFSVTNNGYTWSRAVGVLTSPNPLPKTMRWKGDGVANVWNTAVANWTDISTGAAAVFSNGDRVTLDGTGSAAPALALSGTLAPSYLEKISELKNYTLGGSGTLSGAMALVIDGASSLTLANTAANSYLGGTFIQGSTLVLSGGATPGSGPITLQGNSTLTSNYAAGNLLNLGTNTLKVGDGDSATINLSARTALGAGEGAGIVNLMVKGTVPEIGGDYLTGSWSGFSGTLNVTGTVASAQIDLNINGGSFDHFGAATVNLDAVKVQSRHNSGGNTIAIGTLNGTGTAWLGGSSYAGSATYSIGARNEASIFNGSISDGVAPTTVTKTGSSTLNLRGPHTYTGATNVTAGTLYATGAFAGLMNVSGGTISPGDPLANVTGQIQANGGLMVNNGSVSLDLSSSPNGNNDRITVPAGATTTLGGTNTFKLKLSDGFLAAGTYKLIDGNSSLTVVSGMVMNFTSPLPIGARQTFSLVRNSTGTPVPAYVNLVVAGDIASLTWTGANGGVWDLGATANWTSTAAANPNLFFNFDSANFTDATGAGAVTITGSVIPRLLNVAASTTSYTFSGIGTIDGAAALTKTGSGTLTIGGSGVHTFTGGTTLQSGTLMLDTAAATPLGTGPLFVNGGTLHLGVARTLPNSVVFSGTSAVASTGGNVNLVSNTANTLSGASNAIVNFSIPSSLCTIQGPMSGFLGTINLGAAAGTLRLNGNANANYGSAGAAFDLGTATGTLCNRNGDLTLELGAVSGGASTTLQGRQSGSGATTSIYLIGARNTDAVFAGHIANGGDLNGLNIIKVGTGNWTLSGTSTFTGDMTVQAGRLTLSGVLTHAGEFAVVSSARLHLGGGHLTSETITIAPAAQLTGNGTLTGDLVNHGTVNCSGALTITGNVTNDGIVRLTGGAALSVSGGFINNGTLDLLTGAQTLPANFTNNGIVLDSSLVRTSAVSRSGTTVTVTIQGYLGHGYQLQRSASLSNPDWTNVDVAQTPTLNNATLALTDSSALGAQGFYRVVVSP